MNIAHIIPTAFDYFDDIKSNAFRLVERLQDFNVNSEVITLQYSQPSKTEKEKISGVRGSAPSYGFKESRSMVDAIGDLSKHDLVHLHCPFIGAAKIIINWKKNNPQVPLVCTFYRDVETPDVFSLIIKFYNNYYLSKIFALAEIIAVFPQTFKKRKFSTLAEEKIINLSVKSKDEIVMGLPLTNNPDKLKLNQSFNTEMSISKILTIYSFLTENK